MLLSTCAHYDLIIFLEKISETWLWPVFFVIVIKSAVAAVAVASLK
jgi:hypothetical protein